MTSTRMAIGQTHILQLQNINCVVGFFGNQCLQLSTFSDVSEPFQDTNKFSVVVS